MTQCAAVSAAPSTFAVLKSPPGEKIMQILRVLKSLSASVAIAGLSIFNVAAEGGHRINIDTQDWTRGGGVVYTMDNAADGNSILVFGRDRAGRLYPIHSARASTGGKGGANNAAID